MFTEKYYSEHPKMLEEFINQFGEESLEQLRTSFESCHGEYEGKMEVRFFKKTSPKVAPTIIKKQCAIKKVISVSFSDQAKKGIGQIENCSLKSNNSPLSPPCSITSAVFFFFVISLFLNCSLFNRFDQNSF